MGQEVTLTPEVVAARLRTLEAVAGDLDALLPRLDGAGQRQGPGMWTDIPACKQFGDRYSTTITDLRTGLDGARAKVAAASDSLRASAAALTNIDQATQDRLTALVNRLGVAAPTGPLVCTPYDNTPAPDPAPVAAQIVGGPSTTGVPLSPGADPFGTLA